MSWAGIWNKKGQIQKSLNHLALFIEKEDAKKFVEWRESEEQGKLSKLPCAVGDTIYTNHSMKGWYFRKSERPYAEEVVHIGISNGVSNYINVDFGNGHMLQFKFSDIGKTVFLTRQEAEGKLAEMGGKK